MTFPTLAAILSSWRNDYSPQSFRFFTHDSRGVMNRAALSFRQRGFSQDFELDVPRI